MIGLLDPACLACNGRRMLAKLQASNASDSPMIARFYEGTGHDFASDEAMAKEQVAELLAFIMKATGLPLATH